MEDHHLTNAPPRVTHWTRRESGHWPLPWALAIASRFGFAGLAEGPPLEGTTRRFCPLETNQQRSSEQGRVVVVSPRLLVHYQGSMLTQYYQHGTAFTDTLCFFASSPSWSLPNSRHTPPTTRVPHWHSQVSGRRRNRGTPKACGGVGTGKGGGGGGRKRQPGKRNELPRTRRKSTTAMQEILRSNTYTMHRDPPNPRPALPYHPQLPVFRTPTRNLLVSVRIERQSPCSAKSRSYRISRALFCFPPCLIFGVAIYLPCTLQLVTTTDSAGKSTLSSPLCSAALLPLLPT